MTERFHAPRLAFWNAGHPACHTISSRGRGEERHLIILTKVCQLFHGTVFETIENKLVIFPGKNTHRRASAYRAALYIAWRSRSSPWRQQYRALVTHRHVDDDSTV
jgi:hypothetical protein